jgi:hypothetical protein
MGRYWFRETWTRLQGRGAAGGSIREPLVYRPSRTLVWTVVDHGQTTSAKWAMRQQISEWASCHGTQAEPAQTDAVTLLRRVCPPLRAQRRRPVDWTRVESELGARLPSDYRELIDDRGAGVLADVVIRAPGGQHLELTSWLAGLADMVAALRSVTCGHFPPAFYPEPGGILPWGEVDGGHVVGWATIHPDPDRWPVVVLSPTWEQLTLYGVTATGYLLARLPGPDLRELAPSG